MGMHRRQLPILQPCPADWGAMRPVSASTRHCEQCSLEVHTLEGMTEAQANALLIAHQHERLCIRYRFDPAGHIRFADSRPLRAATLAVTLLSACATPTVNTPATTLMEPPSPTPVLVFDDPDEFDPYNDSLYQDQLMGVLNSLPASWERDAMIPPDPIPMTPEDTP